MTVTATIQGENTMLVAWDGTMPRATIGLLDHGGELLIHGLESDGSPAALIAVLRACIDLGSRQKKDVFVTVDPFSPHFPKLHRLYSRFGGEPMSVKYRFKTQWAQF